MSHQGEGVRVLVTGSRNYPAMRTDIVRSVLEPLTEGLTPLISGQFIQINGAEPGTWEHGVLIKGLDQIAKGVWTRAGGIVLGYPADWDRHGKAAGPIRNKFMVTHEEPDLCIGFPWFDSFSSPSKRSGTKDCMEKADAAGVPVFRVDAEGTITRWGRTYGLPGLWPYRRTDDIPPELLRTALPKGP